MAERWVTEQWCHGHSAWSMAFQALALVQSQLLGDWCWKWFVPCFWGGGFSLELLMLIIDLHHLHPNIHWLSTVIPFNLSNFTDSSFPILYTPSARIRSPNLSQQNPSLKANPKKSRLFQVMISLFLPSLYADQLHVPLTSIGHVTSAVQNLRCLEWSVVRILFSSSAAWKGGLLGLEVVVDSGNDVPRWETMKATWD